MNRGEVRALLEQMERDLEASNSMQRLLNAIKSSYKT